MRWGGSHQRTKLFPMPCDRLDRLRGRTRWLSEERPHRTHHASWRSAGQWLWDAVGLTQHPKLSIAETYREFASNHTRNYRIHKNRSQLFPVYQFQLILLKFLKTNNRNMSRPFLRANFPSPEGDGPEFGWWSFIMAAPPKTYGGFHKWGIPDTQQWLVYRENPMKMDVLGVPLF